jgi:hypothetical protein
VNILNKVLTVLHLQIKDRSVTLPKKVVESPKIQDNNQAIKLGAINEDNSKSVLRSKSPARKRHGRGTNT